MAAERLTDAETTTVVALRPDRGRHLRVAPLLPGSLPPGSLPPGSLPPGPRPAGTPGEASAAVAAWLEYLSFGRTLPSAGRSDVVFAERGIARLHAGDRPVGLRHARRSWKPAAALGRYVVLVSQSGFTAATQEWADVRKVALLELAGDGTVRPVGTIGRRLVAGAGKRVTRRAAR